MPEGLFPFLTPRWEEFSVVRNKIRWEEFSAGRSALPRVRDLTGVFRGAESESVDRIAEKITKNPKPRFRVLKGLSRFLCHAFERPLRALPVNGPYLYIP